MTDFLFIKFLTIISEQENINTNDVVELIKSSKGSKVDFTELIPPGTDKKKLTSGIFSKIVTHQMGLFNPIRAGKIFRPLLGAYRKLYGNLQTLDGKLSTEIRQPINNRKDLDKETVTELYERSKKEVALNYREKEKIINEAAKKVYEKNKSTIQVKQRAVIDLIKENINVPLDSKENALRKFVALMLSCGSRPAELIHVGTFTVDTENPNYIKQIGLAKRRKYKIVQGIGNEVTKPIIAISPKRFVKEITEVRAFLKTIPKKNDSNKDNSEDGEEDGNEEVKEKKIDRNVAASNKIFREYFKERLFNSKDRKDKRVVLYICRAVYANVSYVLFGKNKTTIFGTNPSLGLWINSVLAHDERVLTTSFNYSFINVDDCEPSGTIGIQQEQNGETDEFVIEMTKKFFENKSKGIKMSQNKYEKLFKNKASRQRIRDLFKQLKG